MDGLSVVLLVGLIVFVTHALEGITGFGCTVMALPFVAMLLGIKEAVPVLAVLAWVLAGYIVLTSWKNIVWKEYFYIVICVGCGLPFGIFLFKELKPEYLKALLAVFMIVIGSNGLYQMRKAVKPEKANETPAPPPNAPKRRNVLMSCILFLGGMVHGAFASGGPFVVIYASKALPDKSLFRVSLCLLWFTMNSILMIQYTVSGIWTWNIGMILLGTLPFFVVGMFLGDYLHHRFNDFYFRMSVYGVLLVSGLVMFYDGVKVFTLTHS